MRCGHPADKLLEQMNRKMNKKLKPTVRDRVDESDRARELICPKTSRPCQRTSCGLWWMWCEDGKGKSA